MIPADPFGRARLPDHVGGLERRVARMQIVIEQLRAGQPLDRGTAEWVAGAFEAFLYRGEPIDAALGLRARRGSHATPQALIGDERQPRRRSARSGS